MHILKTKPEHHVWEMCYEKNLPGVEGNSDGKINRKVRGKSGAAKRSSPLVYDPKVATKSFTKGRV